ncbi:hypothetical protein CCHOA_06275 [Corynebacterium choanae]|uniref:Uncharacterized protein n=1 Tax=Corynebacterium choanae TaxID=1862358 RepID=A0A3G6JBX5_9CORY|nr:hypothetical protein CCHOA_06275 [Corynebacterium choanae]
MLDTDHLGKRELLTPRCDAFLARLPRLRCEQLALFGALMRRHTVLIG